VFDTSRIRYYLPILAPAQVVHYTQADDLEFTKRWISYLLAHDRVASTVHYRQVSTVDAAPRLIVSSHEGHSERCEHLGLGKSLILHETRLTVMDTDNLHQRRFHLLPNLLDDHHGAPLSVDGSLTFASR